MAKEPENWCTVKLGDIISLEYGKGLKKDVRLQGEYPVVGSNGIIDYHNDYLIEGPSIIVGRKGSMGKVTWIDKNSWPIDTTYYIKRKSKFSLRWLYYSLIHLNLEKLALNDVVPGLNRDYAYIQKVFVPPFAEQQKIAVILSTVDEAIHTINQLIEAKNRFKKGLMQRLFTQGIGHTDFKETKLGKIPKEWEIIPFEKTIISSKEKIPYLNKSEYLLYGKYPIIDQGQKFIAGYSNAEEKVCKEELPVVIFGDHTRLFKYIDFKFICGAQGTKVLVPDKKILFPRYYYYALLNLRIKNLGYSRHYRILKETSLPLPGYDEQQKIAAILTCFDNEIGLLEMQKDAYKTLKKGLMQQLLTGKVQVKVN